MHERLGQIVGVQLSRIDLKFCMVVRWHVLHDTPKYFFKILSNGSPGGRLVRGPLKGSKYVENTFITITFKIDEISNWNFGHIFGSPITNFLVQEISPPDHPGGSYHQLFFSKSRFSSDIISSNPRVSEELLPPIDSVNLPLSNGINISMGPRRLLELLAFSLTMSKITSFQHIKWNIVLLKKLIFC